jgi:hypothetical protein
MRDIKSVIEALLAKRPNGFRNKHLAEALGVSPSRACQLLARRILSGELARIDGPRSRYIRGHDRGVADGSFARGAAPRGFWRALVEDYPKLAYVALRGLGLTELRTRQRIRAELRGMIGRPRYLVVDFEGVDTISEAVARELFLEVPAYWGMQVEAINADPRVAQTIQYIVRVGC